MISPLMIWPDPGGMLVGTLGRAECEFVGALIIRWHHVHRFDEWTPVSRADIANLFDTDSVAQEWARNPFWKPHPHKFADSGFITGWMDGPDVKGTLTEKFHLGIAKRIAYDETRRRREARGV